MKKLFAPLFICVSLLIILGMYKGYGFVFELFPLYSCINIFLNKYICNFRTRSFAQNKNDHSIFNNMASLILDIATFWPRKEKNLCIIIFVFKLYTKYTSNQLPRMMILSLILSIFIFDQYNKMKAIYC